MLRLDVEHAKAVLLQIVDGAVGRSDPQCFAETAGHSERIGGLRGIQPFNPAVKENVLPKDVELDLGMLCQLRRDLAFEPSGLPKLKPSGGHINRERSFGKNAG